MNKLKIALSVLFVVVVAALVVRAFLPKRPTQTPAPRKAVLVRPAVPAKPVLPVGAAKMAIILDDWGNRYDLLDAALKVRRPLTLAVLPDLKHSRRVAEDAHKAGLGVMLHMPMEPVGGRHMEPRTILTTTPDKDVLRYLDDALKAVPHAEGMNNHQGSAATSDERVMRLVLGHLKKKNLFFVDSHTIATSVCAPLAGEIGTRFASRQVFLDNVAQVDAIKEQLRKARDIAFKRGKVVVIGHDKLPTLRAIKEMVPELEVAGIQLVYVRDVVQ